MILFPNAKINIGLNILNKRNDGYHDLETVFYPIPLYDALEAVEAPVLHFESSGIVIPGRDEENLCLKAYELIKKDFELPALSIHLHKKIPIGAGLGGGSSDAAYFIRLLNEKFNLKLDTAVMQDYARKLGADCAFFIESKPVFAYGKGEEFKDVSLDLSAYSLVLIMPPVFVSTADAFRGVKCRIPETPLQELIKLPLGQWKQDIKNDFEESVFKAFPIIQGLKNSLYDAGALYVSMSGSGAAVYGIFAQKPELPSFDESYNVFYL
ncbi:4-(cytidine 5'-diphospho)-2-C-methyl-D-erythritol kinase [Arcticibacter eurypsychrophilus]|uniref:4-(cytidine 5'-diphospho)-2-C-methyl-D-erythritol kinase n=1 Tax=Arcticibacter eurypsychrophilus TaxID=1434752 RepID=UPI00084D3F53|nr:4-(cytidine 5'-diphospho)-2-C-methyl-D-erythritol kinase [Arcticibacter eurypsychrophilus]